MTLVNSGPHDPVELFILPFKSCHWANTELSYLALTLFKIGALAFGGGFTIIPLIQYEVVDRFQWVNTKEFLDGLVLYNFGRATFVDIPSVIFTLGAFIALLKKVDLAYILLTGAILPILLFGFLT